LMIAIELPCVFGMRKSKMFGKIQTAISIFLDRVRVIVHNAEGANFDLIKIV
jgi:hypothetical protein